MSPLKPTNVLALALCIAVVVILAPLWAPLVLATWFADLLRPAVRKLERHLGGRRRAAGVLIVVVAAAVLAPLIGIGVALTHAALEFVGQVRAALEGRGSLAAAFLGGDNTPRHPALSDWADLASRYGAGAWRALAVMGRASAGAVIAVLVFGAALYTLICDGDRGYAWLEENAPIPSQALARLAGAFRETGRGLIVGAGGAALAQGALATAAYLAIGIPRALILGPLTAVCGLVPFVGTGLVWVPLAIELGVSRQYGRLGLVVAIGVGVSLIDNFLRPFFTRYGRLELPTFVVLISMLGGVAVFGPTGALLGPLVVRLCVESLAIERGRRRGEAS